MNVIFRNSKRKQQNTTNLPMIVPHFKQWPLRLALTCMLSPLSCVSSMTIVGIIFCLCQLQTRTLLFRISRFCYCLYFLSLTELTDFKNTSCIAITITLCRTWPWCFLFVYLDLFSFFFYFIPSSNLYIHFSEIQLSNLFLLKHICRINFPSHSPRCLLQKVIYYILR